MRIVFPYPAYWPYVRRGVERYLHDLTQYLAARGHTVEIITSKPGRPRVAYDNNVQITYLGQFSHPLVFQYAGVLKIYAFGLETTAYLLRHEYDVAHLWSFSGVAGAPLLRRMRNLPYLLHLIVRDHHWNSRADRWAFGQLIRRADKVAALSPKWAEHESHAYGVPIITLPPPVDLATFRPQNGERDMRRPVVIFPGDLGDARKGGALLLRAWDEIHRRCPAAVLALAGPFGLAGFHAEELIHSTLGQLNLVRNPAARAAIEVRGPGTVVEYPRWLAEAAVTVLPSFDEAFGMVVTESLASGTPVVCSSDGGPGEIITQPEIGATVPIYQYLDTMSAKRAQELAEAVLYGIELSRDPATAKRCRDWAGQWSLEQVGQQAESIYAELIRH